MASSPLSATTEIARRPVRSGLLRPKRFGSEVPRIWTAPLRELDRSASLGFECIDFAEDVLELELMPWQKWFLIHALELHPTDVGADGQPLFRFRKVVLLVGRQNGKSTVMQALTLWRMFVDRCSLVVGTAQDLEIAETLLRECYELAEEVDTLKAELRPLARGSGKMSFRLKTGETYKVKAASRRGGRGLSGELVLLDELREHQSWDAWAAVTKTTNAKERAQIYGISNAGDASSIVLRYLRKLAHDELGDPDGLNADVAPADLLDEDEEVDDSALGIFEWSAPPGAALTDRNAWAQANPSLGHRVRESTLASDSKTDPEWVFRTEVLCQWSDGSLEGPFPPGAWEAGTDVSSGLVGNVAACVDVSVNGSMSYIAFASLNEEGVPHVEVRAQRAGVDWVLPWLQDPANGGGRIDGIAVQARGAPVCSITPDLKAAGLPIVEWGGADLTAGTGKFFDLVRNNGLRHLPQPVLDVAAATAVPKLMDGGAVLWNRRASPNDIAPLVAATGAVWLLTKPSQVEAPPQVHAWPTDEELAEWEGIGV